MRIVSDESCREIQNTHFMFYKVLPKPVPFMRNNVERHGTVIQTTDDNNTRLHFACRKTKAKNVHSEYVIRNAFPRQELIREHASI